MKISFFVRFSLIFYYIYEKKSRFRLFPFIIVSRSATVPHPFRGKENLQPHAREAAFAACGNALQYSRFYLRRFALRAEERLVYQIG